MATDTGDRKYSEDEAWNRIFRTFRGEIPATDVPSTLPDEILSRDWAISSLAELVADSLSGYALVVPMGNVTSAPTGTTPTLGGWLYAQNGSLKWIGSSGTISTIAGS